MSASHAPAYSHATALVIGECGVLISGDSGSGKSALALACIAAANARGDFAALVGDDRVQLLTRHGRVIGVGHPAIAGQIERRGWQIESAPTIASAVLRLVVHMVTETAAQKLPRLANGGAQSIEIAGVLVPFLAVDARRDRFDQAALVLAAISAAALEK